MVSGCIQRVVLGHFKRKLAKLSQEASRGSFSTNSNASSQSDPRKNTESRFGAFQAPARKVVPGDIQRVFLKHFKRKLAKLSQEASRGSFSNISNASSQSDPRKHSKGCFGAFQAPTRKVVPVGIQRMVLEHFNGKLAKLSQEASRGSFSSISNASSKSYPRASRSAF